MKILVLIIKKFFFFFFIVFSSYLFVVNFTLTYDNLIDALIKSVLLSLLLIPMSITSVFPNYIANKATCEYMVIINRPFEEGIKLVRHCLKTMTNISMIKNDIEKGNFVLDSEFSYINIEVKGILDDSFLLNLTSKPKFYLDINNYNYYQKDLKNIIQLLKINIDDEDFDLGQFDIDNWQSEVVESLKTLYPLRYRYHKSLMVFLFTLLVSIYCYNHFLASHSVVSIFFFFASFILYSFYILSNDLEQIREKMKCLECKKNIYSEDSFFILRQEKNNCSYCASFQGSVQE